MISEDFKVLHVEYSKPLSTLFVKLEVGGNTWYEAVVKAKDNISKNRKIPGFRKGKAPSFLSQRNLPEEVILQEAFQYVEKDCRIQALSEAKKTSYKLLNLPSSITQKMEAATPHKAIVTFLFETSPVFSLPNFNELSIPVIVPKLIQQDIVVSINNMFSPILPISQEEVDVVAFHDTVFILFAIWLPGDDPEKEKKENSGHINVTLGTGLLLLKVEESMIGMKKGEEKVIELVFPPYYPNVKFRNKKGNFWIKVESIQRKKKPELTIDLIHKQGFSNIKTLEEFDVLAERMGLHSRIEYARFVFKRDLTQLLASKLEIEFPRSQFLGYKDAIYRNFLEGLRKSGLTLEDYLKETGGTQDSLEEELKFETLKQLKTIALFEKIIDTQKISTSKEEEELMYNLLANFHATTKEEIQKRFVPEHINQILTEQKVMDFLMKSCDPKNFELFHNEDYFNLEKPLVENQGRNSIDTIHKQGKLKFSIFSNQKIE